MSIDPNLVYLFAANNTTRHANLAATIKNSEGQNLSAYVEGLTFIIRLPFNNMANMTVKMNNLPSKYVYFNNAKVPENLYNAYDIIFIKYNSELDVFEDVSLVESDLMYIFTPTQVIRQAALTATVKNSNNINLASYTNGLVLIVKMPFNNMANTTLKINNLAAKYVYHKGIKAPENTYKKDEIHFFIYNASKDCFEDIDSVSSEDIIPISHRYLDESGLAQLSLEIKAYMKENYTPIGDLAVIVGKCDTAADETIKEIEINNSLAIFNPKLLLLAFFENGNDIANFQIKFTNPYLMGSLAEPKDVIFGDTWDTSQVKLFIYLAEENEWRLLDFINFSENFNSHLLASLDDEGELNTFITTITNSLASDISDINTDKALIKENVESLSNEVGNLQGILSVNNLYYPCSTPSNESIKIIPGLPDNFELTDNLIIKVLWENSNINTPTSLNTNGIITPLKDDIDKSWNAGDVVTFKYSLEDNAWIIQDKYTIDPAEKPNILSVDGVKFDASERTLFHYAICDTPPDIAEKVIDVGSKEFVLEGNYPADGTTLYLLFNKGNIVPNPILKFRYIQSITACPLIKSIQTPADYGWNKKSLFIAIFNKDLKKWVIQAPPKDYTELMGQCESASDSPIKTVRITNSNIPLDGGAPKDGVVLNVWFENECNLDNISLELIHNLDYFNCDTPANTAIKQVTVSGKTLNLDEGNRVRVFFEEGNSVAQPLLRLNDLTEKPIKPLEGTSNSVNWAANSVLSFRYDGDYWRIITSTNKITEALPVIKKFAPAAWKAGCYARFLYSIKEHGWIFLNNIDGIINAEITGNGKINTLVQNTANELRAEFYPKVDNIYTWYDWQTYLQENNEKFYGWLYNYQMNTQKQWKYFLIAVDLRNLDIVNPYVSFMLGPGGYLIDIPIEKYLITYIEVACNKGVARLTSYAPIPDDETSISGLNTTYREINTYAVFDNVESNDITNIGVNTIDLPFIRGLNGYDDSGDLSTNLPLVDFKIWFSTEV